MLMVSSAAIVKILNAIRRATRGESQRKSQLKAKFPPR
jgi:hypothetical protein